MTEDKLWKAIEHRDAAFDGIVFYGVVTTGVYCRPSCPSRRPRRDNVRYFPTTIDAERAGLRACRRCRPDEQSLPSGNAARIVAAHRLAAADCDVTLRALCTRLKVSERTLRRAFAEVLGVSPQEFLAALRLDRLKDGLRRHARITDAVHSAGYGSTSRVYEQVDAGLGMTPSAYAQGGAGQCLRYVIERTPLGYLAVAATERGLCFAQFGSDAGALAAELREAFPEARLEPAPDDAWLRALLEIAAAPGQWRSLPVDVRGSAFQARVWRALRDIPAGATRTYAQVAQAIGAPRAVRAVANACAANPVALAIPCHRVVPKSGGTGGYRWGEDRKAKLLESERG